MRLVRQPLAGIDLPPLPPPPPPAEAEVTERGARQRPGAAPSKSRPSSIGNFSVMTFPPPPPLRSVP